MRAIGAKGMVLGAEMWLTSAEAQAIGVTRKLIGAGTAGKAIGVSGTIGAVATVIDA